MMIYGTIDMTTCQQQQLFLFRRTVRFGILAFRVVNDFVLDSYLDYQRYLFELSTPFAHLFLYLFTIVL